MTHLHLYIAIAILFALDSLITAYALRAFPQHLGEANPVMAALIKALGANGALVATKVAVFALLYWLRPALVMLQLAAAAYVGVLAWNLVKVRNARAALKARP